MSMDQARARRSPSWSGGTIWGGGHCGGVSDKETGGGNGGSEPVPDGSLKLCGKKRQWMGQKRRKKGRLKEENEAPNVSQAEAARRVTDQISLARTLGGCVHSERVTC